MDSVVFPTLPTYLFEPSLAGVLSLVLTVILPIVAALFMRSHWSAFHKGLVLLVLAAVKTYLEAWIGAVVSVEPFNFVTTAYTVLITFGLAVVSYFGLLRNTDVQRAALAGWAVKSTLVNGQFLRADGRAS